MQNPYLFDSVPYSDNTYIGVTVGEYKFIGVTTSHPLGFVINDISKFVHPTVEQALRAKLET